MTNANSVSSYYEQVGDTVTELDLPFEIPNGWNFARLRNVCLLLDGEKKKGNLPCLDAKFLRGRTAPILLENGRYVAKGDNIILVDGENSGEVFSVPQDGYMGSTFKQLWLCSAMHIPFLLFFIRFYKETLRNSKKGAAIPHLNKELFYSLLIGIPPIAEQERIVNHATQLLQLLK